MTTANPDQAEVEQFGERLLGELRGAAVTLMLSVGHRTRLLEVMRRLGPSTSHEVAAAAGLHERYVREWLGAMVMGRIVRYDPGPGTYVLPAAHAALLTRDAGPDNVAALSTFFPVFAAAEDDVLACFTDGGGVPYSCYPRFHEVMDEDSSAVVDASLLEGILPLAPGLVGRLRDGAAAADVGCGSGHAVNVMAQAFPNSSFVGYDLSQEAVDRARREAADLALGNARFEVRDAAALDATGAFDLVTAFDAIHDQGRPRQVLAAIARALRPGGTFLMGDMASSSNLEDNVDHPLGAILYAFSCLHCLPVSLAQGDEGLGTAWGEQKAVELLHEAGFGDIAVRQVEGDVFNNYFVAPAPAAGRG